MGIVGELSAGDCGTLGFVWVGSRNEKKLWESEWRCCCQPGSAGKAYVVSASLAGAWALGRLLGRRGGVVCARTKRVLVRVWDDAVAGRLGGRGARYARRRTRVGKVCREVAGVEAVLRRRLERARVLVGRRRWHVEGRHLE